MTAILSLVFLLLTPLCILVNGEGSRLAISERTVWAWTAGSDPAAAAQQLRNESWNTIIDGIQAFCGMSFRPDGMGLILNESRWDSCYDMRQAARDNGVKFHVCISGKVPDQVSASHVVNAAVQFAREHHGVGGFSLDDEYDCAPRSTFDRFESWMDWVNDFSRGLHAEGLQVSAAVQAMFGIQDVPYQPNCGPNKTAAECSQACRNRPQEYALERRVGHLMSLSDVDRWLEMDTYYFSTGRFLDTLQWHLEQVRLDKLGVGMMNRDDLTLDGLQARFHAIDKSGVDWINMFLLPLNDEFLPWLKRWKTKCAGCGVQPILGCYDMDVPCEGELFEIAAE